MIKAVITDIEGTTTSISYVYEVLFPYARQQLETFINEHDDNEIVRAQLQLVSQQAGRPLDDHQAITQLREWMDEDKKFTPLKTLQGLIWQSGYEQGHFKGHLYEDVPRNLRHWYKQGIALYVYSSGSVQAQKLLFAHTDYGDLTGLFSGYFDTRIGNKREISSYTGIVEQIGLPAQQLLFLSDIEPELEAAALAGMDTVLLVRDGRHNESKKFRSATSFDQIEIKNF